MLELGGSGGVSGGEGRRWGMCGRGGGTVLDRHGEYV